MKRLNVLVGCESSGTVREAFRKLGHNAWSCDILPADDGSTFHMQWDVLEAIDTPYTWDLAIFHPPCTHLAVSGAAHFAQKIKDGRQQEGIDFFMELVNAPIERIAVENPVCIMSRLYRKPDQIIQPWMFGHDASKKTCLWLKNLQKLTPTSMVPPPRFRCRWCGYMYKNEGEGSRKCDKCHGEGVVPRYSNQTPDGSNNLGPSPDRWKLRSKTYQGIADAMALQWGGKVE